MQAAPTGSGKTAVFLAVWIGCRRSASPCYRLCGRCCKRTRHLVLIILAACDLDEQDQSLCMNYGDSDAGLSIGYCSAPHLHRRSDGCTVTNDSNAWKGCRASSSVSGSGKFYFECEVLSSSGICRVGWSTSADSLNLGTSKTGAKQEAGRMKRRVWIWRNGHEIQFEQLREVRLRVWQKRRNRVF